MKLQLARGVQDIKPDKQLQRQEVIRTLQKTFESYGFVPLDTPVFERYDVLSAKFAAGEESDAMKEVYTLQDNGERALGLRFDLTVPLARYVGMNIDLKLPFKRYQIGKVYRDAPVKAGRYREFTQCDVDIIGSKIMAADATCVNIALDVYKALGINAQIKINNRKVLQSVIKSLGVAQKDVESAMISLDKLDKYGKEVVQKELQEKNISLDVATFISLTPGTCSLGNKKDLQEKFILPLQEKLGADNEGLQELQELFTYFEGNKQIIFDPALARGLGYYTGTVFEVYAEENTNIGAIGAGGRYDNLIGGYLGKQDGEYPAVGISFGLDRIMDVLETLGKTVNITNNLQVFVIPIGETKKESFALAQELRTLGIGTDVELSGRKDLKKNIKYADAYNIPYVLLVGENELKEGNFTLKNLSSGEEFIGSVKEIAKKLSSKQK